MSCWNMQKSDTVGDTDTSLDEEMPHLTTRSKNLKCVFCPSTVCESRDILYIHYAKVHLKDRLMLLVNDNDLSCQSVRRKPQEQ